LAAWVQFKSGSGAMARDSMERAITLAPNDGWTQYTAASVFFTVGQFKSAEKSCTVALAANFKPQDTSFLLARALRSQDKVSESEVAAARAIANRPDLGSRWEIVRHTVKMADFHPDQTADG
jgi:predicted Zn-dependent protease